MIKPIEAAIVGWYAELFPNYAFTDLETALNLMAAEIKTLRLERDEAKNRLSAATAEVDTARSADAG